MEEEWAKDKGLYILADPDVMARQEWWEYISTQEATVALGNDQHVDNSRLGLSKGSSWTYCTGDETASGEGQIRARNRNQESWTPHTQFLS